MTTVVTRRSPPTPRMLGGKIPNEFRRRTIDLTLQAGDKSLACRVDHIYVNPTGEYRCSKMRVVVRGPGMHPTTFRANSFWHDADAAKYRNTLESVTALQSACPDIGFFAGQKHTFEEIAIDKMLTGGDGGKDGTKWRTGMFDLLGYTLGFHNAQMAAEYDRQLDRQPPYMTGKEHWIAARRRCSLSQVHDDAVAQMEQQFRMVMRAQLIPKDTDASMHIRSNLRIMRVLPMQVGRRKATVRPARTTTAQPPVQQASQELWAADMVQRLAATLEQFVQEVKNGATRAWNMAQGDEHPAMQAKTSDELVNAT